MKPKSTLRHFLALSASSVMAMSSASAQATSNTWNTDTAGNWTDVLNWLGDTAYAEGADNTATFGNFITANRIVTLDANITIGNITATDTSNDYTISGANTLTLDRTTGTPTIDVITNRTLTISSNVTGNDGLQKTSTGTLILSGTNNYTGTTTISAGKLQLGTKATTGSLTGTTSISVASGATLVINRTNAFTQATDLNGAVISGDGSVTSTGGGTHTLSGANTYTGVTTVGGGTNGILEATILANGGVASSIGASSSDAGNLVLGSGDAGTLKYIGATNVSTDRLFTIGTSAYFGGLDSSGAGTVNFTNSGAVLYSNANAARIFKLGGSNTGQNILNPQLTDNGSGVLTVDKIGTGTWVLANTSNSYTGVTTVQQGTLAINSINDAGLASAIGKGTLILGAAGTTGTLLYTGAEAQTSRTIQINNTNGANLGGGIILNDGIGALTFTAGTFNPAYTNTSAIARPLTLGGTNGGTIQGAIIDVSGTNRITVTKNGSGTWVLGGNNTYTGSTTLNAGTLKLDYSTNDTSKLSDTATNGTLLLNGGTLELSGGSHAETVLSTTINNGTTFLKRTGSVATTLSMGGVTFTGGALDIAADNIATTSTGVTSGILSQRATVAGANFAMKSGSNIVAYDYATNGVTGWDGAATTTANFNYTSVGNVTLGGNRGATSNTFKITTDNNGQSMNVGTYQFSLGSLLFAGAHDYSITTSGAGRINTAFILHNYATNGATLTLGAMNGTMTQFGTGKTILSENATANNALNVFGGAVQFSNNLQIGTNSGVVNIGLNNGTLIADTTAADIALNNGGLNSRTVSLGAGGGTLDVIGGNKLTVSGVISDTAGQLPMLTIGSASTNGTIEFTAANTYTGATRISGGTLTITGATQATNSISFTGGSLGLNTGVTVTAAKAAVDLTNGTIKVTGSTGAASYTLLTAASITGTPVLATPVPGYNLQVVGNDLLLVQSGGGPGPLDHFAISAISSPQVVGTPITGITLTAQDASNQTVTDFSGTVTFGGTGGFSGTSATFSSGALSDVTVTPTISGSNLTFTVTDGVSGKTGSTIIATIQSQYEAWAGGTAFDADANGDGVSNGLAWLLGASGPNVSALNKLPTVTQSGGDLLLTFTCLKLAGRGSAVLNLQHSGDLGISDPWFSAAVPDTAQTVSGVTFTVPSVNADPNLVNLQATIPAAGNAVSGKLFGRLKAEKP